LVKIKTIKMQYEELTRKIIGCAMKVHSALGCGFQGSNLPKGNGNRKAGIGICKGTWDVCFL
jgi:hypothetical protein